MARPWLAHRIAVLADLDNAERTVHTAVRAALAEWLPEANRLVMHGLHAAADQQQGTPPNPDDLALASATFDAAFTTHVVTTLDEMFGERFLAAARDATISDQIAREDYVRNMTLRITNISHTTRETIADVVREGIARGYSIDSIAAGVDAALSLDGGAPRSTMFAHAAEEDFGTARQAERRLLSVPLDARDAQWREQLNELRQIRDRARNAQLAATRDAGQAQAWEGRARTIARTEVMGAVNGGTDAGMVARADAFGETVRKMWLATEDHRTRENHRHAEGQVVDVHDTFVVGTARLRFPGDPLGPAREVINCRCVPLEFGPDDEVINPRTGARVPSAPPAADPGSVSPENVRASGADVTASTRRRRPAGTRFADEPTAAADVAATPNDQAPTTPPDAQPWTAVLCVEGSPTGDDRMFAEDSLTWRALPLPLMFQYQTADWGHTGSVPVGRIDTITREGSIVRATGVMAQANADDPTDMVARCIALIEQGIQDGVSVDVDDMVVSYPDEDGIDVGSGEMASDANVMTVTTGRIMAATIVSTPAFAEARIALGTDPVAPDATHDPTAGTPAAADTEGADTAADAPAVAAAAAATTAAPPAEDAPVTVDDHDGNPVAVGDPVLAIVDVDGTSTPVSGNVTAVDVEGGTVDIDGEDGTAYPAVPTGNVWGAGAEDTTATVDDTGAADDAVTAGSPLVASANLGVLLAAGGPNLPPREWFSDPHLSGPTPLTIGDDGRVYGHLALWGTCHTGIGDVCVTPPTEDDYSFFHVGEILTDSGERVPTGRITLGGGHADPRAGYRAALSHYDESGAAAADVVAGADEFGIYLAGGARSNLSDEQLREFRGAPLSGDWRRIQGQLRLMGALSVNLPGFPVPRPIAATSEGVQVSLAAAGVLDRRRPAAAGPVDVAGEVAAVLRRRGVADRLAASIGRDPRGRLAALVRDVHGA